MRIILLLPLTACLGAAFLQLASGDNFSALLWLVATFFSALIFLPIVIRMDDKTVPIFQIFVGMILLLIFFSIIVGYDFNKVLSPAESFFSGILGGFLILSLLMAIQHGH
jgi:hypothetical protein